VDAKHRVTQLFAILALICGCILALGTLGGIGLLAHDRAGDVWVYLTLFLTLGLAACLFSLGIRGMRWSKGLTPPGVVRLKWERIVFGFWVLFCLGLSYFQPSVYLRPPENTSDDKLGVWVAMALLGSGFVISGLNSRSKSTGR